MTNPIEAALKAAASQNDDTNKRDKDRLYIAADGDVREAAVKFKEAHKIKKEAGRKYDEAWAALRAQVDPIRTAEAKSGGFSTTTEVEVYGDDPENRDFAVQVQYTSAYSPLKASKGKDIDAVEAEVKTAAGEEYDNCFERKRALAVKKAVVENPEKLEALVGKLLEVMSPAEFANAFELTETIVTKPAFDRRRYENMSDAQNEALNKAGLKQTVRPKVV